MGNMGEFEKIWEKIWEIWEIWEEWAAWDHHAIGGSKNTFLRQEYIYYLLNDKNSS